MNIFTAQSHSGQFDERERTMAKISTNFLVIFFFDLLVMVMGPHNRWSPDAFAGPPSAEQNLPRVWEGTCGQQSMGWMQLIASSPDPQHKIVRLLNEHDPTVWQTLDEIHPRVPPWTFYNEIEIHRGQYRSAKKYFRPATIIRVKNDVSASDIAITTAETCNIIKENTPLLNSLFGALSTMAVLGAEHFEHAGYDMAAVEDCFEYTWYSECSGYVSDNDIAIIKLKQPRPFTDNTKPVCMPAAGEAILQYGTPVTVSGWDLQSREQKNIQLQVVPWDNCPRIFLNRDHSPYFCIDVIVPQQNIGTYGYEDILRKNTWIDSGAPVLVQRDGRYVMLGIVTLSKSQTENANVHPRVPAVVANLSYNHYQDFIQDTITAKSKVWNEYLWG